MLLRLKLLVDVQNVTFATRMFAGKQPPKLLSHAELAVIRSPSPIDLRKTPSEELGAVEKALTQAHEARWTPR